MDATQVAITISEILHAEPSPTDPIEFLPFTDILIIVAVLFGTVGCVLILRILYRKWKSRIYKRTPSDILPAQKKNMTDYDKRILADKINESRRGNIKKSFVGTVSSKSMIFTTIGLILLVLLWFTHIILERFHR